MKKLLITALILLISAMPVCHAGGYEWIAVADHAILPDESLFTQYPASVTLGQQQYDLDYLLITLLGEDYITVERTEYDYADEYRSSQGDEPWEYRTIRIYDDEWARTLDQSFSYGNPWVHGERGGEYQAPPMNMLPDESVFLCRSLLKGIVPDEWIAAYDQTNHIRDRWSYSDRWMTDEEYKSYCYERTSHYFVFSHLTEAGIPVLDDRVYTNIGVDGISFLDISWRDLTESDEFISPMPLSEALAMANSTRSAPCTLLTARLVYSSWLTGNDTANLSWQLVTDHGTYIVDCVLNKHMCDTYEY